MEENLEFIYQNEFWFVSAFINSSKVNGFQKSIEIENLIKDKLNSLTEKDIYRKELTTNLLDMIKNVSIKCKWVSFLENFPYKDENSDQNYNTLGYFQFDIEYYKNDPTKKKLLNPILIQQIPFIISNSLKEYNKNPENKGFCLDIESPIYVFVISNKTKPNEIS